MDTGTITIEIKRETAILLLWIASGVVFAGATFLAFYDPVNHWKVVNATGIACGVFLVPLLMYMLRPPVTFRARIIGAFMSFVILGATAGSWAMMKSMTSWQREMLLSIRTTIGRGVIASEAPDSLMKVLQYHHDLSHPPERSIAASFRRCFPDAIPGYNFHRSYGPADSLQVLVESIKDTLITVVAVDAVARGVDPKFTTATGHVGGIQMRYTLTARGLDYVYEN